MDLLLKAVACGLAGMVLQRLLDKQGSSVGIPFAVAVCLFVLAAAVSYLQPVLKLLRSLQEAANLDTQMLSILLKAVGIGLIGEIAALICTDSGNGALGRAIEIAVAGALLWLSIPMLTALLELVQRMTGEL